MNDSDPPAEAPINALAIAALISGIAAWFVCPLIGGVITIQMARGARREIRLTRERGDSLASLAATLGWINVVVWAVVPILVLVALAAYRLVRQ